MSFLSHEREFRGADTMGRLKSMRITICGAGALGANLCEALARAGAGALTVIDRDRVEEGNLATQPWYRGDVGMPKTRALSAALFRAVGARVAAEHVELTQNNATALLRDVDLVVDCFDNTAARAAVKAACGEVPCLHAGMSSDYGEVIWNEAYAVPDDSAPGVDVCDYPLTRNLVMLTTTLAAEVVLRFIADGRRESYTLTFGDLRVAPLAT